MIALWTARQHEWLAALGHQVLVQGVLPEARSDPLATLRSESAPTTSSRRPPAAPPRAPRASAAAPRHEPVQAPGPAPRKAAPPMPDRLHFALIRASGCNPSAPGVAQVIAQWPTAAELRGNPAAKRALWPRLRALRKQALP